MRCFRTIVAGLLGLGALSGSICAADPYDEALQARIAKLERILHADDADAKGKGAPAKFGARLRDRQAKELKVSGDLRLRYQGQTSK